MVEGKILSEGKRDVGTAGEALLYRINETCLTKCGILQSDILGINAVEEY